tara:strand:- start:2980 stop:3678 length:699 start_codon:yes stop_codon:yes gene_type:complete
MKIYTEVNYQWVDGRLVETSSKSFDYTGNLDLCGGGGGGGGKGGGGGGGGGTLGAITDAATGAVSDVTEQVENVATDPVGTVTGSLEPLGDAVTDIGGGIADVADKASGEVLEPVVGAVEEGLATGTESLAMNSGMAENLSNMGNMADNLFDPIASNLATGGQMVTDNIDAGMNFIGEKAQELSTFIHGSSSPTDEPLKKGAISGSKKGKGKSELGTNKGKQRARKSLRIGQ